MECSSDLGFAVQVAWIGRYTIFHKHVNSRLAILFSTNVSLQIIFCCLLIDRPKMCTWKTYFAGVYVFKKNLISSKWVAITHNSQESSNSKVVLWPALRAKKKDPKSENRSFFRILSVLCYKIGLFSGHFKQEKGLRDMAVILTTLDI